MSCTRRQSYTPDNVNNARGAYIYNITHIYCTQICIKTRHDDTGTLKSI